MYEFTILNNVLGREALGRRVDIFEDQTTVKMIR